jgi:hypothetical protein
MGDEVQDLLDLGLEGKGFFVHGCVVRKSAAARATPSI